MFPLRLPSAFFTTSFGALAALLLVFSCAPARALAAPYAQVAIGATLTLLSQPVDVAGADATFGPATDGRTLNLGDQVRTGIGGSALITFFDGSEVMLAETTTVRLDPSPTDGTTSIFQATGTTVNRIQPQSTGFQTSSPSSVALVRGTTYVVTVRRFPPPGEIFPRSLPGETRLLVAEDLTEEGGQLVQTRRWRTVTPPSETSTREVLGPIHLVAQAYYAERGHTWRVRSWESGADHWDTFEDFGIDRPLDVGNAGCTAQDPQCVTTAVLFQDKGTDHTGRVDVQPRLPLPQVSLGASCRASAVAAGATAQATVTDAACSDLQALAYGRDASSAIEVARQVDDIAREAAIALGVPVVRPAAGATPYLYGVIVLRTQYLVWAALALGVVLWGVLAYLSRQRRKRQEWAERNEALREFGRQHLSAPDPAPGDQHEK